MAKIMLTGGTGFLGYYISKELIGMGCEVIAYDAFLNYIDPLKSNYNLCLDQRLSDIGDQVRIIRGDTRNLAGLISALQESQPDVVIQLAAIPLATASNQLTEDATQINLNGTVTLMEAIRVTPSVKRMVFASSSFVYGDFQYSPADEEHPTNPIDVYGGSKLAGEAMVKGFARRFGIEFVIIRPSAVYGPTDANRRVTQIFVENSILNRPLVLHDGGHSQVDFTYCEDTAHGFVLASLHPAAANEVFNITRGDGRSIRELAEIISQLVPGTIIEERPAEEIRPERGSLGISKARKLLGFEPSYSLEVGMERYVSFVKKSGALDHVKKSLPETQVPV